MTSGMTALAIAVGQLLMTHLRDRRANRSAPRGGFLPDGGSNYTAAEGWILSSRFGGDNPALDSSGNPSGSAGGDCGAAVGEATAEAIEDSSMRTRRVLIDRMGIFLDSFQS